MILELQSASEIRCRANRVSKLHQLALLADLHDYNVVYQ
jgi:hypothetical protein